MKQTLVITISVHVPDGALDPEHEDYVDPEHLADDILGDLFEVENLDWDDWNAKWDDPVPFEQWFVNVYEVSREYGGPEEGGWWYDTGTLVKSIPCGTNYDLAERARDELKDTDYPRTDKRYSVLGGEDYNVVVEDHPGKDFPEYRPHFE